MLDPLCDDSPPGEWSETPIEEIRQELSRRPGRLKISRSLQDYLQQQWFQAQLSELGNDASDIRTRTLAELWEAEMLISGGTRNR